MEGFSLTDPSTSKRVINALNISFDSLADVINTYKPDYTTQDYAILTYTGFIEQNERIIVDEPAIEITPIFCQYGSELIYVGSLEDDKLTFSKSLVDGNQQPVELTIYQPYRILPSWQRATSRDKK